MTPTPFSVVVSGGVLNKHMTPSSPEATLATLAGKHKKPLVVQHTVDAYHTLTKKQKNALKMGLPYFVGGVFDGPRDDAHVTARTLLTLDIEQPKPDNPQPPPPDAVAGNLVLLGGCGWVYTSIGHTVDRPRYRVVLPLGATVHTTEELHASTLAAAKKLGIEAWCQAESWVLSQPMFLPAKLVDGTFLSSYVPGKYWKAVKESPTDPSKTKAGPADIPDHVLRDPIMLALRAAGLYIGPAKDAGAHYIKCPFVDAHDNENSTQTMYMEANYNGYAFPSVKCFDTAPDVDGEPHLTYASLVRWLKEHGHIDDAVQAEVGVLENTEEMLAASSSSAFPLDEEPPKREWAVQDFAPIGLVTMLTGPGGQGKSMLLLQVAIHAATGQSFGAYKVRAPLKTLMLSYEDDRLELHRRTRPIAKNVTESAAGIVNDAETLYAANFHAIAAGQDLTDSWILMKKTGSYTPPSETPRVQWIIDFLKRGNFRLLTIDPAVFTHTIEENSNGEVAAYMRMLTHIAREAHCAVIVVHHAGKSTMSASIDDLDQTAARGASAFADNARSVALCVGVHTRDALSYGLPARGRYMLVKHVKSNYAAPLPDMIFERCTKNGQAWLEYRPEYTRLDESQVEEIKIKQKADAEDTRTKTHAAKVYAYLFDCDGPVSIAQIKAATNLSHDRYAKRAVEYMEQQDHVEAGRDGNRILVTLLDAGRKYWKFVQTGDKK